MTNIKLDDTWRETNESFFMHYNDQLHLLDSLVDSDEKLPDNTRVTFLESAVESVPDLRRVKITDNVIQAQLDSTSPISYRSYFDLLRDAAFHLDQATKRGNKFRRTNVHFSGPNDEYEHQNLSSDDNQVTHQEYVYSEPPESLSYSLFQSHCQGSSTPNTQKIFLPKPIWEKLSKDQQQMIIDHNRSLPKSGSTHLSTPNKSPSPLPHKPTPQQTEKYQQVHTHNLMKALLTPPKLRPPLLTLYWQWSINPLPPLMMILQTSAVKRSRQIQVCQRYLFQHANHTNQQLVDRGANRGLAGSDMRVIHNWTPVKSLTSLLVTPCLMPTEISMSASLPTSTFSWMHLQKPVGHTQKSLLFSQPISITVHPKSLTGMPYAHSLHGHPHPASKTLSMSPPGMGLIHIPRITSKSTLRLAILFSTSPDAVKLLQQTPSSLTLLLLMMVLPWPNSSVAVILLSVMPMA